MHKLDGKDIMDNKAVVFGGSGFLGSHVADRLTEEKYDVVIFDKRESPWLRPGQTMVCGDILDRKDIVGVVKGAKVVYNFSGLADMDFCAENPVVTIEQNVLGHNHILEACRENNIERIV